MQPTDGLWQVILPALGVSSEYLVNRHGPCPGCGGKDRFRFDDKDGRGTFYCGGGGDPTSGDGYDLLSHVNGWDKKQTFIEVQRYLEGQTIQPKPTPKPKPNRTQQYAIQLWNEAVHGVQFHPYAQKKQITWEAGAKRHPSVSGRVIGQAQDCILVPIRNIETNKIVSVQAINHAGKKQTFGPVRGHGFICGNTLSKSIPWVVVEGWADAISVVFHVYEGNAVCFAAMGMNNMDRVADEVVRVYAPDTLTILEDAA